MTKDTPTLVSESAVGGIKSANGRRAMVLPSPSSTVAVHSHRFRSDQRHIVCRTRNHWERRGIGHIFSNPADSDPPTHPYQNC